MDFSLTRNPAVQDQASAGGNIALTLAAATWKAPAAKPVVNVHVLCAVDLEFRQDGTGDSVIIPADTIFTIRGVDDLDRLEFKTADASTVYIRWER